MEAQYSQSGTSSPAAVDGTHTHTLLEKCLLMNEKAAFFVGMELEDHDGKFTVNAERAERVEFAMTYIRERATTLGATIKAEERVDPKFLLGRDDLSGTVDVQLISPDVLEIIDYKDGMGVVEAVDNPQLEQYGFGTLAPFYTEGNRPTFKTIRMTIIQPKLREKGLVGITFFEVTLEQFLPKFQLLVDQANATDAPDAPLVPGESQCRYCAHGGNCSARTAVMLEKAGIKFGPTDAPPVLEQVAVKSPLDLTERQFREIVEALPMIRTWLDGVEEAALARIQSGKPIPGLKVVRGRGLRSWAFTEEEIATKLSKMGVPKGDIWETKVVSPAKAEKLKWVKRDGTQKQLSAKQLEVVRNEMVTKGEGKLTVVSAADERPAVEFSDAAKMFSPVESLPSWLIS
jgi:hypothetical protein